MADASSRESLESFPPESDFVISGLPAPGAIMRYASFASNGRVISELCHVHLGEGWWLRCDGTVVRYGEELFVDLVNHGRSALRGIQYRVDIVE